MTMRNIPFIFNFFVPIHRPYFIHITDFRDFILFSFIFLNIFHNKHFQTNTYLEATDCKWQKKCERSDKLKRNFLSRNIG